MLAAKYSSDVLQLNNCQVTEAIQSLPPELREIIHKLYLAIKLREREALGWNEVNEAIEIAPFCEKQERIVKVLFCSKCDCDTCSKNGVCYTCKKMEFITISVILYMIMTTTNFFGNTGKQRLST